MFSESAAQSTDTSIAAAAAKATLHATLLSVVRHLCERGEEQRVYLQLQVTSLFLILCKAVSAQFILNIFLHLRDLTITVFIHLLK